MYFRAELAVLQARIDEGAQLSTKERQQYAYLRQLVAKLDTLVDNTMPESVKAHLRRAFAPAAATYEAFSSSPAVRRAIFRTSARLRQESRALHRSGPDRTEDRPNERAPRRRSSSTSRGGPDSDSADESDVAGRAA